MHDRVFLKLNEFYVDVNDIRAWNYSEDVEFAADGNIPDITLTVYFAFSDSPFVITDKSAIRNFAYWTERQRVIL